MNGYLLRIDRISAWTGKAFAWCIVGLTTVVCFDVVARYVFNAPTQWGGDASLMLYGTLFMMAGAYTLSRNGHVRGDVLYRFLPARVQAGLDLGLYLLFFVPGIAALAWFGVGFFWESWGFSEKSQISSSNIPIYPLKLVIPLAGAVLLLQGAAEIARCLICLRWGQWPQRLHDVEEIDIEELKADLDAEHRKERK
ncbi:MAG TPA: TRAP transporter small permease subunit [Burkholderiales bacterium]|nr:TRAP transporter small permease subunit [Burkholderiales bacterium]